MRQRLATILGQGLSSASNLVLNVVLAAVLSARSFGTLVAALSIYYLAQAVVRAAVGDVLVSGVGETWAQARVFAWTIGMTAAIVAGIVALAVPTERSAVLLLAVSLPMLVLNEAMRYRAWAVSVAHIVVAMDGMWLVVASAGALVVLSASDREGWHVIAVWVAGAAASTLIGLLSLRSTRRPQGDTDRTAVQRARRGFVGDQVPQAVAANVMPVLIAVFVGVEVAAAHRAALLPFMAAETALVAVRVTYLPSLMAGARDGTSAARERVTVVLAGVALVASLPAVALFAPSARRVLGESGALVGWWFLAGAAVVMVRALGRPAADTVAFVRGIGGTGLVRLGSATVEVVTAVVGGVLFGLPGVLVARVIVVGATATIWWVLADRLHDSRPTFSPGLGGASPETIGDDRCHQ